MTLGSTPCLGTQAKVKAHVPKKDLYTNYHTPSSVKAKNNPRIETSPNSSIREQINKRHFSATARNESLIPETNVDESGMIMLNQSQTKHSTARRTPSV